MLKRRQFIKIGTAAGASFMLPWSFEGSELQAKVAAGFPGLLDPLLAPKFVNAVPNALNPGFIYDSGKSIQNRRTMKIGVYQTQQGLGLVDGTGASLMTTVWGYGESYNKTTYPGKTIEVKKGKSLRVKWENRLIDVGNGGPFIKRLKYLLGFGTELPHLMPVDTTTHWAFGDVNHRFGTNYTIANDGIAIVPHLHGGHTESDSDGNPEYWFTPYWRAKGPRWVKKWYKYDNDQEAATLWYHDHSLGLTRLNVYAGLAGFYILRDNQDTGKANNPLNLPAYPYEAAFAIQDRCFDQNGQFWIPSLPADVGAIFEYDAATIAGLPNPTAAAEFFGDHILVNGMAWPKMDVEPRKYRIRLLNGSDSRFFMLRFENEMGFWQIGSDDGLLNAPVPLTQLILAPGERADLIVDFAGMANGTQVVLRNIGPDEPFGGGEPELDFDMADPATTGSIMRFEVTLPLDTNVPDDFDVTAPLRATPFAVQGPVARTRKLVLFEGMDEYGRLQPLLGTLDPTLPEQDGTLPLHTPTNGALGWFQDITENPGLNDTEIWEIYNVTADAHPMHVHLVAFEVLNRQKLGDEGTDWSVGLRPQPQHNSIQGDLTTYGQAGVLTLLTANPFGSNPIELPALNELGPKDVVHAFPGEVTRIKMKFDRPGRYVWHCHILSHEDHEMMRPLHVGPMPAPNNMREIEVDPGFAMQNYPNPFFDKTNIRVELPEAGNLQLEILSMNGQRVRIIGEGSYPEGTHILKWDGRTSAGMLVADGIYIARMIFNDQVVATGKMLKQAESE